LHHDEFHNLDQSPNIIRMIKSVRRRCEARMGENDCIQDFGEKGSRKETTRKTKTYVGE
jgi:hypothetical protein